ncbi:HesA/MoeB/ThiF family protein [Metabacillus indicus]|uniref:HesA/MoeB/ThiF family protein n=1 Tax=Metabacillus indicus TaxID=246786 RepID=UPI000492EF33|nr:ThiF family adenylyltransferase [Metabacillus indicus]KEZ50242.1 hypothetical protein AZ46_0205975 [Metabacillus indicus LMG 22858]
MNPVLKTIYTPIIVFDGKVQIGKEDGNLELEDLDGSVRDLLNLMDGTRNTVELANEMNIDHADLLEILNDLDEYGLVEDASAVKYTSLNENERERYRSNLNYFSNFSTLKKSRFTYQETFKHTTVALLGLGGFSLTAAALAGMGTGRIIGLDYDSVELSNLNRQFLYCEDDIGKLKTEASSDRLKKINSEIDIEVHNVKIEDAKSLLPVIRESDIVINGIDQPSILSTRWVNFACVKLGKPYILGGIGHTSIILQKYVPGEGNGCFDCYLLNSLREAPEFIHQLKAVYGASFQKRNTAFAPNIAMITGLVTNELAKLIAGYERADHQSSSLEISSLSFERLSETLWKKASGCPTCNGHMNSDEPADLNMILELSKESRV